jgi:hypothetical protein
MIDQGGEAADRGDARKGTAQRADAGAQQLRLAAEPLQPAGGALARALDALQALLAALADRNQLGQARHQRGIKNNSRALGPASALDVGLVISAAASATVGT